MILSDFLSDSANKPPLERMWFNCRAAVTAYTALYLSLIVLLLSRTADPSPLRRDDDGFIIGIDNSTFPHSKSDKLDDLILPPQSLNKRGNLFSCFLDNEVPSDEDKEDCKPIIPGVDKSLKKIREKGNLPARTGLFYTKWDTKVQKNGGQEACREWARCELRKPSQEVVTFDNVVDRYWSLLKGEAITKPFWNEGERDRDRLKVIGDPFPKHVSQAFAESCSGDVYLCIPQNEATNNVWDRDSAWGGWEYPALTQTDAVQRIYRVDPNNPNTQAGRKTLIWDRSTDPPDIYTPRGSRKSILPEGLDRLPKKYYPRKWEMYDDNNNE